MKSDQEKYYELSYYTLAHKHPDFIHQHIVDAYGAQNANINSKPISIFFTLMGLYLYLEKGYTGRKVQLAHMELAKTKKDWPHFELPEKRGDITATEVLNTPPGPERDEMIHKWCVSVWDAYRDIQPKVRAYLNSVIIL